jgi:methyl-accepting chemotaxis protein
MWRGLRYRYRLMAAMLVVSLPMMIVLAALLTTKASSSLTAASQRKGISVARAVALRLEDWLSERRESLTVIAQTSAGQLSAPATATELAKIDKTYNDYSLLLVTDLTGKVTATRRPGGTVATAGQAWFRTAVAGHPIVTSPVLLNGRVEWIMAQPIRGAGGRVEGVAIANLDPVILAELLNPELDPGDQVVAVDP